MKKRQYGYLAAIMIVVLAIVLMVIDFSAQISETISHPLWWFYMVMTLGFGLMALLFGMVRKSPFYYFLAAFLLDAFLVYIMIALVSLPWYVVLIIGVMFLLIVAFFDLFLLGNKTEEIAMNNDPSYRTYREKQEDAKRLAAADSSEEAQQDNSGDRNE